LLDWQRDGASLEIRRALEPWPLLCDTPVEGGSTSRFVDSSLQRLEIKANAAFLANHRLRLNGRVLPLGDGWLGLRYRHSSLYPSLHPCIEPHLPLQLAIEGNPDLQDLPARFVLDGTGEAGDAFQPLSPSQEAAAAESSEEAAPPWASDAADWPEPAGGCRTLDLRLA